MNTRALDNQANRQNDDFSQQLSALWDHTEEAVSETPEELPEESTKLQADEPQQPTQEEVPEESSEHCLRQSERYTYRAIQKVAPCDPSQVPEKHAFRDARFHDISRGGVSFFWAEPPDFEFVAVSLGDDHMSVALMARVVRYQAVVGLQNEYLVCCEFVSRLDNL